MVESRTKNSAKNIIINNIYQLLNIILNFVIRTIFIKTLGENYLGINGLFTNILSILSLAELGIGTAMLYSMYKPIADNNTEKLAQLVNYYKVLYRRIAILVLAIGLIIIPLLPYMINIDYDIGMIQIYYVLYLLNSVSSYLLLYKTSIITASQKGYLIKKYDILFLIIRVLLQGVILILFKNYLMYLIIQIIATITCNFFKSATAEKSFAFIKEKKELPKEDKKIIWKDIKSLLFYQIGNVILNNTDNILISIMLGTVLVGYYSNYSMIVTAISGFTGLIFTSLQSSIGNFNVTNNSEGKLLIYKTLGFLAFIVYGFCSISFFIVFQDFITMWIGEQYLLDNTVLIMIILNYYITGILYPNWCYRFTTNLFNKAKYAILICAILNIVLSIILGIKFGLLGIFAATGISRICTTFWYEPYVLYKNIFNKKIIGYFLQQIFYVIVLIALGMLLNILCSYITISNLLIRIIIKELVCVIVVGCSYVLLFRNKKEYIYIKQKAVELIKRKK